MADNTTLMDMRYLAVEAYKRHLAKDGARASVNTVIMGVPLRVTVEVLTNKEEVDLAFDQPALQSEVK